MAAPTKGIRDVVAGALVGLIGGGGLSLLVVLIDNFDLRDPLVNWSPQLLELLSFERSVGFGVFIWLAIGAGVGAAGGLLHVLPAVVRRVLLSMALWVLAIAIFETMITDLLTEELPFESVVDWFYFIRGGLSEKGAITAAVLGAAYALGGRPAVSRGRETNQATRGPPSRTQGHHVHRDLRGRGRGARHAR